MRAELTAPLSSDSRVHAPSATAPPSPPAGEVPNLLGNDDMEQISAAMRPLMTAAGLPITKMTIYSFFVNRVRSYLHLVLCFRCGQHPARILYNFVIYIK